jgi:hypothetical protein
LDGYPPRSYDVIGTLYLNDTVPEVSRAANSAKRLGADAMIALQKGYGGSFVAGTNFTAGNFYPGGFNANTVSAGFSRQLIRVQLLAIKWR